MSAFLTDTAPAVGIDEQTSETVSTILDESNSTADIATVAGSMIEPGQILEAIEEEIPDDDLFGQFFGVFVDGITNSGLFRQGARDDGR